MPDLTDLLSSGAPTPEELLRTLFQVSLTGIILLRPVPGAEGELLDFTMEYLNAAGQRMLGLPEKPAVSMLTAYPQSRTNGVMAFFRQVFETGEAGRYDMNHPFDGLDNYHQVAARRSGPLLVVSFADTVDQDRSAVDQALRQSQAREREARTDADIQRQRLERLFMQAPAAICILEGPDLVYGLVNPAYQQLFPGRQLLGKPILEALPEIASNRVYHTFRQVFAEGRTHEEQALLIPLARPGDGLLEDRYFNFIQQARHDGQGHIDGVLVFAFEVTVQVQARKAAEASARQLQLVTDALPVLIGYLDQDLKYRFANQAYEAWFNQNPEDLLGRPVREVVGEKAYQGIKHYMDRALAGERLDFEARMPYRDNFVKHIRTSYVPDIREGQVLGFYTMVTDVTAQVEARQAVEESGRQARALAAELARTNEELQVANYQLTRTNVDLDNFIYTASHDLKTPILNIEGLMEALVDELSSENLQNRSVPHITGLILNSVQRFKRTLDHLTEITKLQKENGSDSTPVQLKALLAEVQLDLAPAIRASGAQVEADVSACPTIPFSEKNLRSILYNLLSNAIKYQDPNRVPRVLVWCYNTADYQVLAVQDNGLGMDLSRNNKLFTMFNRLHDHVEGSGIGLYMVKKIIENAGGKIEVRSTVGEGSVFEVFFRRQS